MPSCAKCKRLEKIVGQLLGSFASRVLNVQGSEWVTTLRGGASGDAANEVSQREVPWPAMACTMPVRDNCARARCRSPSEPPGPAVRAGHHRRNRGVAQTERTEEVLTLCVH